MADLLNFARTSSPQKKNLDIHTVIDDVIGFVRHHSNLENIQIGCSLCLLNFWENAPLHRGTCDCPAERGEAG